MRMLTCNHLSFIKTQCKKVLIYSLVFTQIYSPAAYGGKLYFEITEEKNSTVRKTNVGGKVESKNVGNKVISSIRLKIWEENENKDTFNPNETIYNHKVEFDLSNVFNPCIIPALQPAFANPGIGCPFHKYFEHSGRNLKINHYDTNFHEQISFTIAHNGEVEIHRLFNPEREIFIKTFGNISTNVPSYKLKTLDRIPSWNSLQSGELGLYLNGDALYCKTKEKKEIEIIAAEVPSDASLTANTPKIYRKGYCLRLMPKNPSPENLRQINPRELGIFCEGDKLFCKAHNKEKMEIVKSDDLTVGLPSEIYDRVVHTLQDHLNPIDQAELAQEEEREHKAANTLYNKTFNSITLKDEKALLQYTLLKGYTQAERKGILSLAPEVLDNLKQVLRDRTTPSLKDQETLLNFTAFCGYTPTILKGKSLQLTGRSIGCYTPFLMDEELQLTASDKLFNKSHLQARYLSLSADTIKNSNKMIGSDQLNVNVKTLFDNANDSLVFAVKECTFQGTGSLKNHAEAEIKSTGKFVSYLQEVDNDGSIVADSSLSFNSPLKKLRNAGLVISYGSFLQIHASERVTNTKVLQGRYGKTAITAPELHNHGSIASLNGPLFLNVGKGENHNSILSENAGGVHLTIGELFKNFKELKSDDFIAINGAGHLHNTKSGTIKADEQLKIKGVSVTNDGLLESLKQISASIPQLIHQGIIKAHEASLNIKDLQNSGKILIEDILNLIVGKGSNEGHIQGNSFTFKVSDQFTNRKSLEDKKPTLHGGKSFILEGEGSFTNQHIVRAEDLLALKNKTLHNESHVEAGGNLELGGGINLINAQGAKILSKGSLKTTGSTSLTNHRDGFISSQGDTLLTQLLSFNNEGTFCSKGLLRLISQGNIVNFHHLVGNLGIYLEAADLFSNTGDVESEETIGVHGAQIVNHKKIQGTKGVTLKATQSFENRQGAEVNSAKGKVTLTSPQFTIQGSVKGQNVDVHHQGATPFHGNVEAIDTLTLHVPHGWSLENRAQVFGHSIVLYGPLRAPGNLNIKNDFIWHNSEALSNDFDIVVGGKINFNIPGSWCNLKLVEAQKGSTVTTPHFSNKGVFSSSETTNFNCVNGFDNYVSFRMQGGGAIHTPAGSITNNPGAKVHQFGHDKVLICNAAQKVRNIGGRVYIEGTLNSTSNVFANEVTEGTTIPKTKTTTKKNKRTKETTTVTRAIPGTTVDTPGQPAYFHVGRALITAHTLLNDGSGLSARELFQFNGTKLDNLTRDYWEKGTNIVKKKKKSKRFCGYKYKDGKTKSKEVPYTTLIGSNVAKLKSQGDMKLTVGGRVYDKNNVAALNGNKFKNRKVQRVNRKKNQANTNTSIPCITNTGEIYADAAYFDLDVGLPTRVNFSDVNNHRTEIPLLVRHNYEDILKGPSPWTLDDERNTPFKIIPRIFISYPNQEAVSAINESTREGYARQEADRVFQEGLKIQLTEQFNRDWEAQEQQKKRRPNKTRSSRKKPQMSREEALSKFLEERGVHSISCEPNPDEWSHITAESLPLPTARLAYLPHPEYRGGERLLASPPVLADMVVKVMMETVGFAGLSKYIYDSLLYARILEDQGYINARRVHGLPPLPTPENWQRLSPEEQLRHQLREMITLPDVEQFTTPTIIYELVRFHDENVLSAINTFPKHIRDAFKSFMGRKMFANYFAMRTRGDLKIERARIRRGLEAESTENNLELENVICLQGPIRGIAAETLFIPTGTIEGTAVSLEGTNVIAGKPQSSGAKEDAPPVIRATKESIDVKAKQSLSSYGAEFDANVRANLESGGTGYLGSQEVITQTTKGSRKNRQETRSVLHNKTKITARKEDIRVYMKGEMELEGIDTKSGTKTLFKSEAGVKKKNVNDEVQETQTRKKKNTFGGKSKTVRQNSTSRAVPDLHEAGTTLTFEAKNDIEFGYSHIKTKDGTFLNTEGELLMTMGSSTKTQSKKKQKNYVVAKAGQDKGRIDETLEPTRVGGGLTVKAKKVIVETPKNLNELAKDPRYGWAKKLLEHPNATVRQIEAEHKKWNHKSFGLTQGGAALLSLAVGVATGGVGSAIGAAVSGSVTSSLGSVMAGKIAGTMASAGFTTLATQASVSLVNNKGNIGKTLKELGSKQNIGATVTSVVAAGLTGGILESLKNPETAVLNVAGGLALAQVTPTQLLPNLSENIQRTAVQTAVSTSIAIASGEKKMAQMIQQGIRGAVASVVQSFVAQHIGAAYKNGEIDTITHKLSHAIAGGFAGALFADDPAKGAISGATGAVMAELVAEGLSEALTTQTRADLGRFAAAATTLLARQDVNTAIFTATTAVENNFHPSHSFEVEQQRVETGQMVTQAALNFLGTEIPECVSFKGDMHARIDHGFNAIQNLPFIDTLRSFHENYPQAGRMLPLPVQGMIYSRSISHLGVDLIMPVTVLDVGLNLTGVGSGLRMLGKGLLSQGAQVLSKTWSRIASSEKVVVQSRNVTTSMDLAYNSKAVYKGIKEQGLSREIHLSKQNATPKTPLTPAANQNVPKSSTHQNVTPRVRENTANIQRAEATPPANAPKPRPTKAVGTPAEEASSARRIQQARAAETEGRRVREVRNKPPEAAHPAPKMQAETAAPKPRVAEKTIGETPAKEISISRSKKINVHHQGVTTPAAAVPQATINHPRGFKPQQHFNPPQRAVQPTTAPKTRVEQPISNFPTLEAPAMVKHHVFNKFRGQSVKSQKYRDFFSKHEIDVDLYALEVTEAFHKGKIHTANNNWTTKWKQWIDANPNASTKEVYQFAGQLMEEYGLSHIPITKYRK